MKLSRRRLFSLFGATALLLTVSFVLTYVTGHLAVRAEWNIAAAPPGARAAWIRRAQVADFRRTVVFIVTVAIDLLFLAWLFRTIGSQMRARETAVEAAAREKERFVTTLASIGDAVIVTDRTGAITFMNPEAERLTGWTRANAAGRPLSQVFVIVDERTRRAVGNPVERVVRERRVVGLANHTVLLSKFGDMTPIADSAAPIRRNAGPLFGVVLVFRDVTEQRRHQEAQARLAAIVESSDDAIVSKNLEGRILTWNRGAERMFGYSSAEAVSQPITLIVPEDRLEEETTILERVRHGLRMENLETVRRRKDGGKVDVSLTLSPIFDAGGALIGVSQIARDIGAAKRFEAELRNRVAERTAELSEKTGLLEGFIYTVAHDLRAPLRAIYGYAEFLGEDIGAAGSRKITEHIERIKGAAQRMDRLIRDLLVFSRVTQVELVIENVSLQRALANALRDLDADIRRTGADIEIRPPLPTVRAEPAVLDQVLTNLLSNAIKFVAPEVRPKVVVSAERTDGFVRLSIRDNGIGIPEQYHDRVFKVFERLKIAQTYPGTGVGLAIVARAAERLDGRVGLVSAPGEGSTFWVELPAAAA